MDPEIARNQDYDDHYANDSKDIHFALLPLHDDGARCARRHVPRRYQHHTVTCGSVRRRPSKSKSLLSPPPVSPIAAPSEEQKEDENNKNEVHIFLQNI